MSWDTTKLLLLALALLVLNWLVRLPEDAFQGLRYLHWVCWATAALLVMFFLGCAIGNVAIVVRGSLHRQRGSSLIPVAGGIAGTLGVLLLPWPAARSWWWLPPLLDLGCVPIVLASLAYWSIHSLRHGGEGPSREVGKTEEPE
jgi:hypothetical protein